MLHAREEPLHMGPGRFVASFLSRRGTLQGNSVDDPIARPTSTAPAEGDPTEHADSQTELFV